MTCIVALEHEGKVYMGGDSAAVSGWDVNCVGESSKVFKISGGLIIGYTSSFRMGQLLQYHLQVPTRNVEDVSDLQWMVTKFIPAVRDCFKTEGFTVIKDNQESGGIFLVGYHGKIYKISSDFLVLRMLDKFLSVGVGAEYAIGAMAAINITDPIPAILKALEISGTYSIGVRPPYYVFREE